MINKMICIIASQANCVKKTQFNFIQKMSPKKTKSRTLMDSFPQNIITEPEALNA